MPLKKQLIITGWVFLLVTSVQILPLIFSFFFHLQKQLDSIITYIISLIVTLINVLVLLLLKKYLNTKYHFKKADLIIVITVLFLFLKQLIIAAGYISHMPVLEELAIAIPVAFIEGIIGVILALKLVSLQKNILKSYTIACYLLLIGNILQVTVILLPIGIFFFWASNFFFSAFFIKTGKRLK